MFLGMDIGSSSSKAALINGKNELVACSVVNMGTGTRGPEEVLAEVLHLSKIAEKEILYTVATGYGRIIYPNADSQVTEISCHAKGVSFLMSDVKTVIDIGGQDSKVIEINADGKIQNFVMNEKCAAGTGRFLEVMARVLGCGIDGLSSLAEKSTVEIPISSICTVFAESEVISRLASGAKREDVAKGVHTAIVKRVAGMCNRVGYQPIIAMTGGGALNCNIVKLMGEELGQRVVAAPYAQAAGAIGAAVFAHEKWKRGGEK